MPTSMHLRARVDSAALAWLVATMLATPCDAAAITRTISTAYAYNSDGAPTAVTTQVDAQPAITTYLTWDNFTPDAAAPGSGTVSAADGNLVGVGASPGLADQFAYDVRDRLTACSPLGRSAASYAYHPSSLLASSTLASGDALQFYYDNAATPLMINTRQPSTGMAASFLGPVRYLSDGAEQVLLTPRKDTAAVYDAAAQSLSPYSYDPYGSSSALSDVSTSARQHVSTSDQYDLTENPFQYASEYRDPTCDAYYLRARWYLPVQQTFLSRDPADPLHRYSYTGGNPVGRTDPSGFKYTGADFSRDVGKLVGKLTPGVWGYIEPLLPVWEQALGGIELAGLLPSFWHHPTTAGYVDFGFLATSVVAEAGAESRTFDRLAPFLLHPGRAFAARIGIDVALGASQTAAQSSRHGRVDVPSLVQGIETTVAGILWSRFGAGVGYRPHNMTGDDVDRMVANFYRGAGDSGNEQPALVYLVRRAQRGSNTTPWMEWRTAGDYHESVVAITSDRVFASELAVFGLEDSDNAVVPARALSRWQYQTTVRSGYLPSGFTARFVGELDAAAVASVMTDGNPLDMPTYREQSQVVYDTGQAKDTSYNRYSRNCHDHAYGIIQLIRAKSGGS